MWKNSILLFCLVLIGCAAGARYDYRSQSVILPLQGDGQTTLVLQVEDQRPYVLSGDKSPDFVGLQRGGWGNAFDVTTVSGASLTEDMATSIGKSLEDAGFRIVPVKGATELAGLTRLAEQKGASRILQLRVREWKSDIYMGIRLTFDLDLAVYDAAGERLAENRMQGDEPVGGAKMSPSRNSQHMAEEFSKRIGYLFNNPAIRDALK
jgi:hypothetical protein